MNIRLAVADDHPMVISGIRNMLSGYPDITLVATYKDGNALLEGLKQDVLDVLLLDIQMPGKTGDELAPVIAKKYPDIKILVLTNFDSTLHVQSMLRKGAHGYLLKTTEQATLIRAIETVWRGDTFIESFMQDKIERSGARARREMSVRSNLTKREKQILQCIVNGDSSQDIADKLFISIRSVENYRSNILLKMDVKNLAMLVRKALEMGIVE